MKGIKMHRQFDTIYLLTKVYTAQHNAQYWEIIGIGGCEIQRVHSNGAYCKRNNK